VTDDSTAIGVEASPHPRGDAIALIILSITLAIAGVYTFTFDFWPRTLDIATQFLSWYSYIGDRLADGDLPAWFPYDGAGEAMIGAPASGWLYLPIMILFAIFAPITAYKWFIVFHIVLAGFGMYAFARRIGLWPLPALTAAISFALGAVYYGSMSFMPPAAQVLIYIPLAMLAADHCLTARRLSSLLGWAALIGFIASQMYIGSAPRVIYGLGFVVIWMLWRILFDPQTTPRAELVVRTGIAGAAAGIIGAGFGAAAILPQFAYSAQSHIPHGDYSQVVNGDYAERPWTLIKILTQALREWDLFQRPLFYGTGLLVFVLLAPLVSGKRHGVPLFALTSLVLFDISWTGSLLRPIIVTFPGLGPLVEHRPTSSIIFLSVTFPLLAAAGIQWFITDGRRPVAVIPRLLPMIALLGAIAWMDSNHQRAGTIQIVLIVVTTLLLLLPFISFHRLRAEWAASWYRLLAIGAVLLALVLPTISDAIHTPLEWRNLRGEGAALQDDPATEAKLERIVDTSDPGTAAEFLQRQQANLQPFRIASWSGHDSDLWTIFRHMDDRVIGIISHTRPSRLGLQSINSYNPVHIGDYVRYIEVMNGGRQDYHTTDPHAPAFIDTGLLSMLNVRYVLVPNDVTDLPGFLTPENLVFQDDDVSVYQNPDVMPRAWIVHDVKTTTKEPYPYYLRKLNTGEYPIETRAFVEGAVPSIAPATGVSESVTVISYEPEEIVFRASASSPGLMVASEMYEEGWKAYVDGKEVPIYQTNATLRGVVVPAGEHVVTMRYEPSSIFWGLRITIVTSLLMLAIWGWGVVERNREPIERWSGRSLLPKGAEKRTAVLVQRLTTASSAHALRITQVSCIALPVGVAIMYLAYLRKTWTFTDEPASLLAIDMVAQHGLPLFPSDVLYLQGAVFSYLAAPLAWMLPPDTLLSATQWLSIGAGILTIPVAMATVRLVVGGWFPAVVSGLLIGLDPTLLQWGVTIRPYAMLVLLSVVTLYLVVRMLLLTPDDRMLGIPTWILVCLAIFLGTFTHPSYWLMMPGMGLVAILIWRERVFTTWRFLLVTAIFAALSLASYFAAGRYIGVGAGTSSSIDGTGGGSFIGSHLFDLGEVLDGLAGRRYTWYMAFEGGTFARHMPSLIAICSLILLAHLIWQQDRRSPGIAAILAAHWSVVAIVIIFVVTDPRPRYLIQALPIGYVMIGIAMSLVARTVFVTRFTLVSVVRLVAIAAILVPSVTYAATAAQWQLDRRGFEPDYWEITEWVADTWEPGQAVITTLPPAAGVLFDDETRETSMYFLAGPEGSDRATRYAKRRSDGIVGDYWLGVPVIGSSSTLCEVLYRHAGNAWLIVDHARLNADWALKGVMAAIIQNAGDTRFSSSSGALALWVRPYEEWDVTAKHLCLSSIS
jgi:hypothetical protein